jgi:hypothetical protein
MKVFHQEFHMNDYQFILNKLVSIFNEHVNLQQHNTRAAHPPGHYYSTIPSTEAVQLFFKNKRSDTLDGISTNDEEQINLLRQITANRHAIQSIPVTKEESKRYFSSNDQYGTGDAFALSLMLNHIKPRRVVEIGSGFTSALMLDFNEFARAQDPISFTFIEPYPDRLQSLLIGNESANIIKDYVQNVSLSVFDSLAEGDVLVIDCSHVSKLNSDVNHIYHKIIPRLNRGVWVHIHDMFFDFEYPAEWLQSGIFWNEQYLVRSFLQFNSEWTIELFTDYLYRNHRNTMNHLLPEYPGSGGGQLWIRSRHKEA